MHLDVFVIIYPHLHWLLMREMAFDAGLYFLIRFRISRGFSSLFRPHFVDSVEDVGCFDGIWEPLFCWLGDHNTLRSRVFTILP